MESSEASHCNQIRKTWAAGGGHIGRDPLHEVTFWEKGRPVDSANTRRWRRSQKNVGGSMPEHNLSYCSAGCPEVPQPSVHQTCAISASLVQLKYSTTQKSAWHHVTAPSTGHRTQHPARVAMYCYSSNTHCLRRSHLIRHVHFPRTLLSHCHRAISSLRQVLPKWTQASNQPGCVQHQAHSIRQDNEAHHHGHRGLIKEKSNSQMFSCVPCQTQGSRVQLAVSRQG